MRGQIFKIDNMTFFTMGGGESPDIDIRFEENAWSKYEFPSREELLEGAANLEKLNCRVDYIITHEPPVKIKGFLKLKDSSRDMNTLSYGTLSPEDNCGSEVQVTDYARERELL